MHTGLQQALETFSSQSTLTRDFAVFCALYLALVLAGIWVIIALAHARQISFATVARVLATLVVAYLVAKGLSHVVSDPRPWMVDHIKPLAPISPDNGFPSDHVLLAAALTFTLWWVDKRFLALFAVGTLLVMFGRLGVGAHHLEDVLGSVAISLIVALVIGMVPLPETWRRPALSLVGMGAPQQRAAPRGPAPRGGQGYRR